MDKNNFKIVFFGTPDFAVESLRAILDAGFNVAAVVTATDKPAGRGHKMQASAVKNFALERNLPVLQPEKLKDEQFISTLRDINADLFVVIAFRMLPEVVWNMPPRGTFNLHASLLPKYRGAAPINHAVINGETKTGVTTFFLQHEIDTGDVIDRVAVDIEPDDDAGSVHDKLMKLGAELTVKTINKIIEGKLTATPQAELAAESGPLCGAPKIFKETGNIDWTQPSDKIHNLVRGLSPYPGAWTTLKSPGNANTEIKIFKTRLTDRNTNLPGGSIVIEGKNMFVACGDSRMLQILTIQPSGKRWMDVDDYLRGARIDDACFYKI